MSTTQVQLRDPGSAFECSDGQRITGAQVAAVRLTAKVKAGLHGGILRRVHDDDPAYDAALVAPEPPAEGSSPPSDPAPPVGAPDATAAAATTAPAGTKAKTTAPAK